MGRDKHRSRSQSKRIVGGFVALPYSVIDSPAYRSLPHPAARLLIDVARQINGRNNGRLVVTPRYLGPLGWRSNDTITRALRQLLRVRLLVETRKGRFPNTPAWFALGWKDLDVREGLDIDPDTYRKDAYHGAPLIPSHGARTTPIAPSHGIRAVNVAPSHGAISAQNAPAPIPSGGEYLERSHMQADSAGVSS